MDRKKAKSRSSKGKRLTRRPGPGRRTLDNIPHTPTHKSFPCDLVPSPDQLPKDLRTGYWTVQPPGNSRRHTLFNVLPRRLLNPLPSSTSGHRPPPLAGPGSTNLAPTRIPPIIRSPSRARVRRCLARSPSILHFLSMEGAGPGPASRTGPASRRVRDHKHRQGFPGFGAIHTWIPRFVLVRSPGLTLDSDFLAPWI